MWRWVTRGLVLTLLAALAVPVLFAQLPPGFVGDVDRPDPNITHSGLILVRGWAFDPVQISRIELYVDDEFQHRATLGLPYIDVVEAYPQWPGLHHANPGFQTAFLANRFSNGPHTVSLRIYMSDGRIQELGRRTINIDNTLNQPPFGSVDQPDGHGIYSATGVLALVGWAADTDGIARVDVQIDGANMQSAMHGDPRPDVGGAFPDFPAALFSGFIANVDTTRVLDGVHLVSVTATDRNGLQRLIGRRTIQVMNSEQNLRPFGYLDEPLRDAVLIGTECGGLGVPPVSPFVRPTQFITPVSGWALDLGTRTDVGRVAYVELLIDGVRWASTDDCGQVLGGFANCYGLPRFDVQRYYPNYPDAPRAGFLFTLDVGALITLGVRPGNHVLKVRVGDQQQTFTELPGPAGIPVFFKCADATQDFPSVGYIDVPTKFDYVGGNVVLQGWALDQDVVAAVEVIVDGNYVGQAQYGFARPDVQAQWPGFVNSTASGWRFEMDTRALNNARHRLTVRVLDGRGNRNEIGSVDFYVYNVSNTP
ncbi:MAG TPA: Ig-like domain-containing protein [Thermoanaerobaculia bacterium]|nr:Ig-like domain-containing protein [Thermoanaerobaculia bacterium]